MPSKSKMQFQSKWQDFDKNWRTKPHHRHSKTHRTDSEASGPICSEFTSNDTEETDCDLRQMDAYRPNVSVSEEGWAFFKIKTHLVRVIFHSEKKKLSSLALTSIKNEILKLMSFNDITDDFVRTKEIQLQFAALKWLFS